MTSINNQENLSGYVDGFQGDSIYGWCSVSANSRIALRIGNRSVIHVSRSIPRLDVKMHLNINTDMVGFETFIPREFLDGETRLVEIIAISLDSIEVVSRQEIRFPKADRVESDVSSLRELRRAAVVCWDLAHNPAGRALVLYNILNEEYDHVDLIGPIFSRYGDSLWEPLKALELNILTRKVEGYADLLQFGEEVTKKKYDLVWICKPRLPGLLIGLRIAEVSSCRVILDIDDYEMSFFNNKVDANLEKDVIAALSDGRIHPADFDATAFAHSLIDHFNLRTVSNVSLQRAFGGEIIPHGRSSKDFDSLDFNKQNERLKLGLNPDSQVVAFIGTVRSHKGVLEIAEAIGMLNDENLVFLVAGTYESESIKNDIYNLSRGRAVLLGKVDFPDLPRVLSCADLICLPQDPSSQTSVFQLPAKLVDGLSLNLKVLVNNLPVYDDLVNNPAIFFRNDGEEMHMAISRVLECPVDFDLSRGLFLEHLSTESLALRAFSYFKLIGPSESLDNPDGLYESVFGRPLKISAPRFFSSVDSGSPRDLVVLWKQQDSGLFGRRVDMIGKYLKESRSFDRVFFIDAPMTGWDFDRLESRAFSPGLTNSRLLYDSVVRKFLGNMRSNDVYEKTFITSERGRRILGRALPKRTNLHREIHQYLSDQGVSDAAHLLVYPVADHFMDTVRARKFSKIVVDLVDDEREFASDIEARSRKHESYMEALLHADLVVTNNDDMRTRFQSLSTSKIHVIPNGVERFDRQMILKMSCNDDSKKIVGYVGNLRDRIDVGLIKQVADALVDDAHVLLVGPTGGNRDVEGLRFHPNISMTGAVTYEESRSIAAGFDIGIIPHTLSSLTDSMNPLKLYLYRELGIPVVSTPIKNIDVKDGMVYQSDGSAADFIRLVKFALRKKRSSSLWRRRSKENLWSSRIDDLRRLFEAL